MVKWKSTWLYQINSTPLESVIKACLSKQVAKLCNY